jgi:hypothetical protein
LEDIIRANPTCIVTLDNDCWWIDREDSANNPFDEDVYDGDLSDDNRYEAYAAWEEKNRLAESSTHGGHCYGEGVLLALAKIVGVKVEWC